MCRRKTIRTERKWYGSTSWIKKAKRLAIYLRDGFLCSYCGTDLHDAKPAEVTLDHFVPWCAGGSNEATNLITACRKCNSGRGAKSVKSYATAGAYTRILRNRKRKLAKYVTLAKAIIAGKAGDTKLELHLQEQTNAK